MRRRVWIVVSIVASLAACGGGGSSSTGDDVVEPDAPVVTGHGVVHTVTISNDGARLAVGATKKFAATATFEDGTSCEIGAGCDAAYSVTWDASPADRITIDSTGLATVPASASFGIATITGTVHTPAFAPPGTAALGTVTGSATVTVTGYAMKVDRSGTTISEGSMDDQGASPAGMAFTVQYRITNTGTEPLTFPTGVSIAIQSQAMCSVVSPPPTPIAAGATGTFTVQVTPTDGPYYCRLLVLSGLGQAPQLSFDITGHGTAGKIAMGISNGGTDNVGYKNVGEESAETLTVQNVGDAPLQISSVTISNVTNCTPSVFQYSMMIVVGGSQPLILKYRPTSAGTFKFDVTIHSSDPTVPSYTFTIMGIGASPEMYVARPGGAEVTNGANDPYGARAIGVPFQVDYDILDTGLGTLNVGPSGFTTENNCTCVIMTYPGASVAGGGATATTVKVTPTASGSFYCVLSMGNNDSDENPYTISISGTGVMPGSPEIEVKKFGATPIGSGASFDQGSLAIGTPAAVPLTVVNTGTGTLITDPITFSSQTNCVGTITNPPMILDPNQPTPLDIKVTPTSGAAFDCVLSIGNNDMTDNENPFLVHITGQGGFSEIAVESSTGTPLANGDSDPQGDHRLDVPFSVTYNIKNTGTGPLALTTVSFFNQLGCTAQVTSQPAPSTAPNAMTAITIAVTPNSLGPFDCEVSLANNDPTGGENPYLVKITGNGVAPEIQVETGGPPQFAVSSGGGFFAGNFPKNVPIQVDFTIRNTGTFPLAVGAVSLPAGFQSNCTATITSMPGTSVPAMGATTFSISLTPTGGSFACRVSIVNDDSTPSENPYTVDVRGNGI